MAKLTWDNTGERLYETGVNRGVLYIPNQQGVYDRGVAWNGLTTVTESPSGAEPTAIYADNIKYLNLIAAEEFAATIEAYMSPKEFDQFDGLATPAPGISIGQQTRRSFGLSYQTRVGNDIEHQDHGYKIHLLYGATAAPSERSYTTINDTPEAMSLRWELSPNQIDVGEGYKPTSLIPIDSTKVAAPQLAELELALYGSPATEPRLPSPAEVIAMFTAGAIEVTTVEPTYDNITHMITIPSVTGVVYSVDGIDRPAGPFGPSVEDTIVEAFAAPGYILSGESEDTWEIVYDEG